MYNKTLVTKRLAAVASSNREEWATNLASLSCHIQQVSNSEQQLSQGGYYNQFTLWCASDEDISVGDRVIDGSVTYTVQGIKNLDIGVGSANQHLECAIVKGK